MSIHIELVSDQKNNSFNEDFFDIITKEITVVENILESMEVSLALVNDAVIAEYNHKYRGKNKPTDVLSFREAELKVDWPVVAEEQNRNFLGEIVISTETAKRQSEENNLTYKEEVTFLFIHGFLHLLGYDHEISEEDERIMDEKTKKIFNKVQHKII